MLLKYLFVDTRNTGHLLYSTQYYSHLSWHTTLRYKKPLCYLARYTAKGKHWEGQRRYELIKWVIIPAHHQRCGVLKKMRTSTQSIFLYTHNLLIILDQLLFQAKSIFSFPSILRSTHSVSILHLSGNKQRAFVLRQWKIFYQLWTKLFTIN